ncbi:MAG: transposase [Bdellovibrionota bacterium]
MKSGEATFSMERLFIDIIEAGEDQELFLSRSRTGIFSPALIMWLEISRRIEGGKSLSLALESLASGCADEVVRQNRTSDVKGQARLSSSSGGLCRARQRLKLEAVERVCQLISDELLKRMGNERWHGKRAYLLDGTTFAMAKSDNTFAKYAPVKNQHRSAGVSQIVCTCLHDLFTGVALSPAFGAYNGKNAVGETELSKTMLRRLKEPGIVIADAGFGIFGVGWTAREHKHDVLLRLTSTRAGAINGKKLGNRDFDKQVIWRAGNLSNHPEIPVEAEIPGRLIRKTIRRDGYRPLVLLFFTTVSEPIDDVVELYKQRERIENDIRSIKYTLGLELISAKSPDVIEKELLLGYAANNLVRSIIAVAADKLGISARQVSFQRGVNYTKIYGNKIRDEQNPIRRAELIERFLAALNQTRHPIRKRQRLEPRMIYVNANASRS